MEASHGGSEGPSVEVLGKVGPSSSRVEYRYFAPVRQLKNMIVLRRTMRPFSVVVCCHFSI